MIAQAAAPRLGEPDGPARTGPLDPAQLEQAMEERGAQRSGQVVTALAPVETGPGERSPRGAGSCNVHVEPGEEPLAGWRQGIVAPGEIKALLVHQRVGDLDTQSTRQVVVARAREAENFAGLSFA